MTAQQLTASPMLSFACRSSQQTPVPEDTTALFGPPLETAFGEEKTEGNPSPCVFVFVYIGS